MVDRPPHFDAKGPVDWALGKVFFETILKPIVYLVLPDRVDPRDWMRAAPLDVSLSAAATHSEANVDDYWFDFVADTGDSDVGAYSLGYLMHGDLAVADAACVAGDQPKWEGPLPIVTHDGATTGAVLPRGQFLFVGGDTAYPVADWRQIYDRFTLPMNYAFEQRFAAATPPAPRTLLGIPGNHDWYDNLDGFNRTFRLPTAEVVTPSEASSTPSTIPKGYCAAQQASYFSLRLPGGWELWALDARDGPDMDHRQSAYFAEQPTPGRVLLATPNPAFVDGRRASWVEELWKQLPATAHQTVALWFSGDTHHYARYAGVPLPTGGRTITSLVSGLGGAALHAPRRRETKKEPGPHPDQWPHARLHPEVAVGEKAIVDRLKSPPYMVGRPGLRWLGAVLALFLGIGALQTQGEVAPILNRICHAKSPAGDWPLILLGLAGLALWTYLKFKTKQTEAQARKRSQKSRILRVVVSGLAVTAGFTAITMVQSRTFGSALADLGFELAALALVGGVGLLFHSGVPTAERSLPRMVALWLTALALGALTIVGCVALARACSGWAVVLLGLQGPWLKAAAVIASVVVGLGGWGVFPMLAGFALAAAFKLGTQRAFVSSFAAVDTFQACIRFRLRVENGTQKASLTGFVISVSRGVTRKQLRETNPKSKSSELVPSAELIDVFTIS